jgi:catecholate siderophore receptor
LGAKVKVLDDKATLTGALFDTLVTNARISDPDDPTVQQMPFDQRVKGVELGLNGYVTKIWEVAANYTHLTTRSRRRPIRCRWGKLAPNTPHDGFNFWSTVEPTPALTMGGGFTAVSHRFADTENTAGVPSYVVFNAMTSYQVNDHLKLQVNLNNVTDKLYFTSVYYVGVAENHAMPSAGRTLIGTVSYAF